jgi:mannose-1-phosphate guanylyltransferase
VIESGARVSASVLDAGAVIGAGAKVNCSIIGAGARVGANTVLDGVVVGDGAVVGADNELLAGARVWTGAVLPDKAVRFSSDE